MRMSFNRCVAVFCLLIGLVISATTAAFADDVPKAALRKAAHVKPTERQLAWQELEFTCFVHFGMNTFTGKEWGAGKEDPKNFNPSQLDVDQWVETCQAAGMKMIILTCKHHDGFCLWPSKYTEHSVKNSPWQNGQGDVVREVADACRKAGLKFGVYLSPWDRHEKTYGSQRYNEFYKKQLTELLTNYGPITEVWWDGACGEGPNGKRQVYDWKGYIEVVRKLQPNAAIFGMGPDVRWVGNENGLARESEWSVIHEDDGRLPDEHASGDRTEKDLGNRRYLASAKQLRWYPAECDVSIRPSWFYRKGDDEKVKSLDRLLEIYYRSVGRNAVLLLNLPPDQRGLFHENDVARLKELREVLDQTFGTNFVNGATAKADDVRDQAPKFAAKNLIDGDKKTYWTTNADVVSGSVTIDLDKTVTFDTAMIAEFIPEGQRVETFSIEAFDAKANAWKTIANSTTIGYKRLLRFEPVTASRVRLNILDSRDCPLISEFGLFKRP